MTWYAVCEADGTLQSVTEIVADPLPRGWVAHEIPERPIVSSVWDKQTLSFSPKPAALPDIDRIEEALVRLQQTGAVNGALATRIRNLLTELLGDMRFRDPQESYQMRRDRA